MKKNILNKRIKEYSALASCILGAGDMAHGQVIYTDVNPDIIIQGNEDFALDLNNDGIADFNFMIEEESYWSNGYVHIATASVNDNSVVTTYTYNFPAIFEYGDSIHAGLIWQHANDEVLGRAFDFWQGAYYSSFSFGNWLNKSQKFLPLRFKIDNENHYGWAKLSVTGWANKITIHSYAYESQPDTHISAGFAGCLVYYVDADNDYHGASDDPGTVLCENPGDGYSLSNDDCDDSNADISPAVSEVVNNNIDDDCDGYIDEFPTDNFTDITNEYSLTVFPNPSSGTFMIDLLVNDKQSSEAHIEVINAIAQTIYSGKVNIKEGKLKKEISLQDVAINGVYVLKLNIGSNVLKVVINLEK